MASAPLRLPHRFEPRPYQIGLMAALDAGAKRAVWVAHRRCGKDKTALNYTIKSMVPAPGTNGRIGAYYYFFPTYAQGKKAIWEGRDGEGLAFLDHFPSELVASRNSTDLQVKLTNGSLFQVVGTDNINSIMGTNPVGCVFSEYSLQDPMAWEYVRPILRENGGWAIFIFTPRGRNHGWELFEMARRLQSEGDPAWWAQRLTIEDTGVLTTDDIEAERREGMGEDLIQQEYYCAWTGVQQGAYYARQMAAAEADGRITAVRYQPEIAVDTWWDLGVGDATSIWFTQSVGREVHVIDYYESSGEGLPHYAKVLQDRGYVYGTHNAPHDIRVRELGTGKSRIETAQALGIKFEIVPQLGLDDGIEAARSFISRCWFDKVKTERGRNALVTYHKKWDEKRKVFSTAPDHDWSSHGSDSFRYLSVGHKLSKMKSSLTERKMARIGSSGGGSAWMGS